MPKGDAPEGARVISSDGVRASASSQATQITQVATAVVQLATVPDVYRSAPGSAVQALSSVHNIATSPAVQAAAAPAAVQSFVQAGAALGSNPSISTGNGQAVLGPR